MLTNYAAWFRALREKRGLTQREAAAELGISGTTICRWEQGAEPRAGHLRKVQRWSRVGAQRLLELVEAA